MKSSSNVISSPVCKVTCFELEKVARIKADLAKEESVLPTLSDMYKLLGNQTRLKILLALGQGELCVCDISHVLGISIAATSHQLKLLYQQRWLLKRDDGKMVYYWLHDMSLLAALKNDMRMLRARSG